MVPSRLMPQYSTSFYHLSKFPVYGIGGCVPWFVRQILTFTSAQDLGTISSTSNPIVWAVGYTRDPAISYTDLHGAQQSRSLYYKTNFTDDDSLVRTFIHIYISTQLTILIFVYRSTSSSATLMLPGPELKPSTTRSLVTLGRYPQTTPTLFR